jgi:ATP synthase protein I|tara:strand:- start:123 stop:368 length:246 start_codon:yes stop_codon:yes gene_type:complete
MVFKKYDTDSIKMLRDLASIGSFGFLMAGAVLLGYFAGDFLDDYFDTSPTFLILFLVLGVVGGFMEYLKIIKKVINKKNKT